MSTWKLRPGADRRIRAQHPWVFSNELAQSPKGLVPGSPVRLVDAKGQFVAAGYGNPNSLIAFRALSFQDGPNPCELENVVLKVVSAWGHRFLMGYRRSFRLVYGEGDFLPGLVVDRYVGTNDDGVRQQVLVAQILSAGIQFSVASSAQMLERFFQKIVEDTFDSKLSEFNWAETNVVIRNDVSVRRLEGMDLQDSVVLRQVPNTDLYNFSIEIDPVAGEKPVLMLCDLVQGQKTGFFLDQAENIALTARHVLQSKNWESPIRILDLCCYVGQWSTQLTRALVSQGHKVEVTQVDVSATALAAAKHNAEREGALALSLKLDVLEGLSALPDRHYDIVIADPPAFIKAKKDVPTGRHAYLKINANAFRVVRRGGWVVSCSCSGLLEEKEFIEVLAKALRRQELQARCVARGGHAADHPNLMAFPEGFYLKMFLHQVCTGG